jgi:dTDP-4-dehydrorhamnose reductase
LNAAGYVRVDDAELNTNECFNINALGPSIIANCCRRHGIRFMTFSSDLVFDGQKHSPYFENDCVKPLNVYGESKAEGERLVQQFNDESLIIRTSAFFGPWDRYNFVFHVLNALKEDQPFTMPGDVIVSPTYVPDLAHAALDLLIDEEKGIWHLSNEGKITWADFAGIIAQRSGSKTNRLISQPLEEMGWKAKRPLYSVLESGKGVKLPALENAVDRYFEQRVV